MAMAASSPRPAAKISVLIPKHAMGMLIGSGGDAFRNLQQIPELTRCTLDQPSKTSDGALHSEGSLRACVVLAERAGKIIDASFERNVRRSSTTSHVPLPYPRPRPRYERPANRYSEAHSDNCHQSSKRHRSHSPVPPPKAPADDANDFDD